MMVHLMELRSGSSNAAIASSSSPSTGIAGRSAAGLTSRGDGVDATKSGGGNRGSASLSGVSLVDGLSRLQRLQLEEMEELGIWECDDEDFALCSFACPSKTDVSGVIRQGLNLLQAEV